MKIKVCGLMTPENIRDVIAAGADYVGFIFVPTSPRYVQMVRSGAGILPDYATREAAIHGEKTGGKEVTSFNPKRVGVFADDMPQNIVTRVYNYQLDCVQLHGCESPAMLRNLKATIVPDIQPGLQLIKTIHIEKESDFLKCTDYVGVADFFLFDTKCEGLGGSGRHFDWKLLNSYNLPVPFFLSGGISLQDAEAIKEIEHPQFYGVDVNSCFELSPGHKDVEKLKKFITIMQQ